MQIAIKCRRGFLPIFDALKHEIGVEVSERIPSSKQGRFNSILSYVNHAKDEDDWYYNHKGNKKCVRHYTKKFHYEEVCCVHLGDFIKWLDRKDTADARLNIRLDLVRLENHVMDEFKKRGFKGIAKKRGLFQTGSKADVNNFLIFAHQLESSENATNDDIIVARIALALPELWDDYRLKNINPWVFSSRMAILCSAVPDPLARKRLIEPKDAEIKAMLPNYERGKKVVEGVLYAHEIAHGTKEEKEERWNGYMDKCIQVKNENPRWKLTSVRKKVADDEGVSLKTIERRTKGLAEMFKKMDR